MEKHQKHHRFRAVAALLCTLVLLRAGQQSSFGGEVWKVSGRVLNDDVNPATGMAGVEVEVYPDENPTSQPLLPAVLSGSTGSFELECVPTGPLLVVRYKKTGHQIVLRYTVAHSAQAAANLPPAKCRKSSGRSGLTAFKPEEILSALMARQKDLPLSEAVSRRMEDIEVLRAEKVDPKLIQTVVELDPQFKEPKTPRGMPGGDDRRFPS